MLYNFDQSISRIGTYCSKHDTKAYNQIPEDALSLWVADMDFETAPCISEAILERAKHPIYGYTFAPDSYFNAIIHWMKTRHNWEIEKDWIVTSPSVVTSFHLVCNTFLEPGDGVLIQSPVYHHFKTSPLAHGMKVVNNPLRLIDGHYEIDFEDFEKQVSCPQVKLFILCNPHNPVGRVWTCGELRRMGELCVKHNVLMISDEIHQDLIYKDFTFTSMGSISDEISDNLIVCTSPGKTFNLPGVSCGNIIIKNPTIRAKFQESLTRIAFSNLSPFTISATTAAYTKGGDWADSLMDYLEANKAYVEDFIKEHLPILKVLPCEATYLLWIDCRDLKMTQEDMMHFFIHKCKLWVHSGTVFGEDGEGFIRMNIATQRSNLIKAMELLQEGFTSIQ